jgi:hypothetical protein
VAWDLGGVRNYALMLGNAAVQGQFVFIMIDDDIVIQPSRRRDRVSSSSVARIELQVVRNPTLIVGGIIKGEPDESQLETAVRWSWELIGKHTSGGLQRYENPQPPFSVSGGFFAFSSACLHCSPFPRWYNEDWTWMVNCGRRGYKAKVNETVVAEHVARKELNRLSAKREQEGEALFEGIHWAYQNYNGNYPLRALKSKSYWKEIVREETKYVDSLLDCVHEGIQCMNGNAKIACDRLEKIVDFISSVRAGVKKLRPDLLRRRMQRYLRDTMKWRSLTRACQGRLAKIEEKKVTG